ncbi:hypothetical protein NC651_025320 [Populus alba x Populus x berolinensis]|nr:hypothetical protein NC651_025320 [Populus alba x Populus x berolinensis]
MPRLLLSIYFLLYIYQTLIATKTSHPFDFQYLLPFLSENSQMASSSHRQRQLSLTPRDNHSHGCITQKMKTSITIEDSKQKVTITTETAHKHRPVSKGNRIALEQEVVNRKKKTTIDKQKLLVREEKHEVKERKIYSTTEEKEKKRIPHKHRSGGTLEVTFKTKF